MAGPSISARIAAVKARVDLVEIIGRVVKLTRKGREQSGLCPFHTEKTGSFTVNVEKGFYHCFGCGAHGDLIRWVMERDGLSFMAALQELEERAGTVGMAGASAPRAQTAPDRQASPYIEGQQAALAVWEQARPARGTIVENWMRARGIDPESSGALDVIRFHPRCPGALWRRWESPEDARRIAPAMVAPILRVRGGTGERSLSMVGAHITLLSGDGRGKAYFEPWQDRRTGEWQSAATRLMWGESKGGAVIMPGKRIAPIAHVADTILDLLDADGALLVGEGIESSLSFAARQSGARLICAALSLGNMEGSAARVGRMEAEPLWQLAGDVNRPAPFIIAEPGRVSIGIDADMKPVKARWVIDAKGAKPVQRDLSGMERSQRCADLAAWWWRHAGANRVNVFRPPAGHDFNDLDQGRRS